MTACIVAFFGFLRCGEFTCKQTFDPSSNLTVNDITSISAEQVTVRLKASKTDVFRKGVIIKLFKTDKNICPYKQLTRYINYRQRCGTQGENPLFVDENGEPLTRTVFVVKLKAALTHLGFDSNKYSGHSFRIGAVTSCSSNLVQDNMIKTSGRWKSDCYNRYIRTSNEDIRRALNQMGQ